MAELYFYYGSSCFGKSTTAINTYFRYRKRGKKVLALYCPSLNDKNTYIWSRSLGMLWTKIKPVFITNELLEQSPYKDFEIFIFDEIQNKTIEEIHTIIEHVNKYNKICYFFGARFDPVGREIPEVKEILDRCNICPLEVKCDYKGCNNKAFTAVNLKHDRIVLNPAANDLEITRVVKLCEKHFNCMTKDYTGKRKNLQA